MAALAPEQSTIEVSKIPRGALALTHEPRPSPDSLGMWQGVETRAAITTTKGHTLIALKLAKSILSHLK